MVATIPIAAYFCRSRISRRKQISYETLFKSAAFIPTGFLIACFLALAISWLLADRFPEDVGVRKDLRIGIGLLGLASITIASLLPALCVVVYYQKQANKNDGKPN